MMATRSSVLPPAIVFGIAVLLGGCSDDGHGNQGSLQRTGNTSAPFVAASVASDPMTGEQLVGDEILVQFAPGLSDADIFAFAASFSLQQVGYFEADDSHQFRIMGGQSVRDVLTLVAADVRVLGAGPNHVAVADHTLLVPNDYAAQAAWFDAIGATGSWSSDISNSTGTQLVILAICDTGVAKSLSEFSGRILEWNDWDSINRDPDAEDDHGHGTAVASIACATGNNGAGMAGMNWGCRILPMKVLDSNRIGSARSIAAGIICAVNAARQFRAHLVINLSLSLRLSTADWVFNGKEYLCLPEALEYASQCGAIMVAAAGNDNNPVDGWWTDYWPAVSDLVLCVGGLVDAQGDGQWDDRWDDGVDADGNGFLDGSNYGSAVDIAAPARLVPYLSRSGGLGQGTGTSLAAPFVAGIAAQVWSVNPSLSAAEVTQILLSSADLIAPDQPVGNRLDAHGSIDAAAIGAGTTVILAPSEDSEVLEITPVDNYGTQAALSVGIQVGTSYHMESFARWDLSSIPTSATIQSAVATFQIPSIANPGTTRAVGCRIVGSSWSEQFITWSNRPSAGSLIGTSSVTTSSDVATFDLTATVQGWVSGSAPNYGIVLQGVQDEVSFGSRESSVTWRPSLAVVYVP